MKEIPLTKGYVAIVDDEDYEMLSQYKWQVNKRKNTNYASRAIKENGKKVTIFMHHEVYGKKTRLHFLNLEGLDVRKSNMQESTISQINMGRRIYRTDKTSQFRGVHWETRKEKWRAMIKDDGKPTHLGYYDLEVDAAKAYDKESFKRHGEFGWRNLFYEDDIPIPNFPQTNPQDDFSPITENT